jgi:hypothetical protein
MNSARLQPSTTEKQKCFFAVTVGRFKVADMKYMQRIKRD